MPIQFRIQAFRDNEGEHPILIEIGDEPVSLTIEETQDFIESLKKLIEEK